MATPEQEFGSGIGLDENLDLVVTERGDTSKYEGVPELEKDLSFNLIAAFDRVLGWVNTANFLKDAEILAIRVAESDARVLEVVSIDVRVSEPDEIEIDMTVSTNVGDIEFVFDITK